MLKVIEAIKALPLEEQNVVYITLAGFLDQAGVGEASIELTRKDGNKRRIVAQVCYRTELHKNNE